MIKQILYKRYKAVLIVACAFFVTLYAGASAEHVRSWNSQYRYATSSELKKDFAAHPESYIQGYDEQTDKEIPYDSLSDYQKDWLTQYNWSIRYYDHFNYWSTDFSDEDTSTYQIGTHYGSSTSAGYFGLIAAVLSGFLLFFIDQKTKFNNFLFTLPIARKKLFAAKIKYLALPLVGSFVIGVLAYVLIEYFGISANYLNATLPQLLYSGLGHLLLLILALALGIALGAILGNIVFGPLAVFAAILLLMTFNGLYYNGFASLMGWLFPKSKLLYPEALFILSPGKTGAPWYMLVALLVLTVLFVFIAQRTFLNISMENDGEFLTVPKYRAPMFWTIFLFTSVWGIISTTNWYAIAYPEILEGYPYHPIVDGLFVTLLCFLGSTLLIYFHEIRKWCVEKRQARLLKKGY